MHRLDAARLAEASIEIVGDGMRVGIDHHDRVERRTFPVVRVDAREVAIDERAAGQRPVGEGGVDLRDRGLVDAKGREIGRASCRERV